PPAISSLFPYTTLFRSRRQGWLWSVPYCCLLPLSGVSSWRIPLLLGLSGVCWRQLALWLHCAAGRRGGDVAARGARTARRADAADRKSTRLNSSHSQIS